MSPERGQDGRTGWMDGEMQSEDMVVKQLQQPTQFKPVQLWFPHSPAVTAN